ncbi:MAG: DNA/RNA nuclease SfsA [Prochlorothrix sp.]|nr:DNA/RNA nuclease SfsA [Prochlorothrix sp.]
MLYSYPPLLPGTLVKRYKRFFADIELDSGELITAHCPNTGPMTGVYQPGAQVYVSQSDNPKRKLAYTWELIQVHDNGPTWVGVNTNLPNRVIHAALGQRLWPQLGDYQTIQREVPYGQEGSRIDFCLHYGNNRDHGDTAADTKPETEKADRSRSAPEPAPLYLEVKNTTWVQGRLALFPDTVTTRGQKHLRELIALVPEYRAVMLYFINRDDCPQFAPGDEKDPTYGKLLREAMDKGVEVLPCRFTVSPEGIDYVGLGELVL